MGGMRYQPQGAARLDSKSRFAVRALALVSSASPSNVATGIPLRATGAVARQGRPQGISLVQRKNGCLQTETLPAIGTASFVDFWYGYAPSEFGNAGSGEGDPTFLTGSSVNNISIVARVGTIRVGTNTGWGALYNWGASSASQFNRVDDTLTPGELTLLVVVRRQSGMEFWRNGRQVGFVSQPPANLAAASLITGSFIDSSYWNSSCDTLLAGRVLNEWTADEVRQFSANPWQIFDEGADDEVMASAAADTALAGAAVAIGTAYGALTTSIRLAGAGAAITAASGALAKAIRFAGEAPAQAAGSGALSTAIPLAGAVQASAAGSGALATSIALTGIASAVAGAAGELAGANTGAALSGAATANASGAGALVTRISLVGAAFAQASASGSAATKIALVGAALSAAAATGVLSAGGRRPVGVNAADVSPARTVVFAGGTRVVRFDGGTHAVKFQGGTRFVKFGGTGSKIVRF